MGKKIELNTLMRIFTIFVNKRWTNIDGYDEVLNRFGELVDALKEDEIELIIELTDNYHWMTYNDYHTSLRQLLIRLYDKFLNDKNKLYIFPIIKFEDEEKIKSGHVVLKMIESIKSSINRYEKIDFSILHEFESLNEKKLNLKNGEFLILVDDYIGSGKTLNSTLDELNKNSTINNNYAILTVAVQEDALKLINERNINIFNYLSLPKGISGHYKSPLLEEKLSLMKKIEDRIPKVKEYRFGFEKSEALITLMRTPNNTFPIFWKDIKHKDTEIRAPFARY